MGAVPDGGAGRGGAGRGAGGGDTVSTCLLLLQGPPRACSCCSHRTSPRLAPPRGLCAAPGHADASVASAAARPSPAAGGVGAQRRPPALHSRVSLPLFPRPLPHLCFLSFFCLFWKLHSLMQPRCQHPIVSSSSLTSPAPVFPRLDLTRQPLAPHQLYPTVGIGQRPRRGQPSGPHPRVCPAARGVRVSVARPRPRPAAAATRAPSLPAAASLPRLLVSQALSAFSLPIFSFYFPSICFPLSPHPFPGLCPLAPRLPLPGCAATGPSHPGRWPCSADPRFQRTSGEHQGPSSSRAQGFVVASEPCAGESTQSGPLPASALPFPTGLPAEGTPPRPCPRCP